MERQGSRQALIAAVLGIVFALAGPCMYIAAGGIWERIVLLSLVLASAALLVTAFILALVAQIYDDRGVAAAGRLHLMTDIFLIAAVGVFLLIGVFAFVLAVIGISVGAL